MHLEQWIKKCAEDERLREMGKYFFKGISFK